MRTDLTADVVWVYGGPDKQALILARERRKVGLAFATSQSKNLTQDADGSIEFEVSPGKPDFPLTNL